MTQRSVAAHVTGVVVELKVAVGDAVSVGDGLILFESMKMHVPLVSPVAGEVVQTLVNSGDIVEEGQAAVLIEMQES